MKTEKKARVRERTIELDDTVNTADETLEALIVSVYKSNIEKNNADSAYKKSRAELLKIMKDRKLKQKSEINGFRLKAFLFNNLFVLPHELL